VKDLSLVGQIGPILIADDDQMLTEALVALFRIREIPYAVAVNGCQALDAIDAQRPRLIFLDIHMPVLGGLEVIQELRRRGLDIPIVVMSSDPDLHDMAETWGFVSYLEKPFSIADVLTLIETFSAA
jgi:CheY-like chemotaxis protein